MRKGLTKQEKIDNIIYDRMPSFANSFFRSTRYQYSEGTLYGYAINLADFFEYMAARLNVQVRDLSIKDFEKISEADLENYFSDTGTFIENGIIKEKSAATIYRSHAAIHAFYTFLYKDGIINNCPTLRVARPTRVKKHSQSTNNSINMQLLEFISTGSLPGRAGKLQMRFRDRDTCILMLFILCGLKCSECTSLNIQDLFLDKGYILVKSRKYSSVALPAVLIQWLSCYLENRLHIIPQYGDEDALFLSLRGSRLCNRSVEVLVKKYTTSLFGNDIDIKAKDFRQTFIDNINDGAMALNTMMILGGYRPETVYRIYYDDYLKNLSKQIKNSTR